MAQRHSPLFLAVALAAILAELVWRLRSGRGYDGRAALTTLGLVVGNIAASAINGVALGAIFGGVWAMVPHRFPVDRWQNWALGFLAVECAYYGFHRASHEIRWLWASHSVHHSAEQLTFLASLRLGWTSLLSLGWLCYLPLIAIGFDPRIVTVLLAINLNYQFFLHSEAIPKLGPLEWVLNTPHHHRAHHASNPELLDRNYGGMLIVWDRLLGTIAPESDSPRRYGLAGKERESHPVRLAFREWRAMLGDLAAARGWRARWAAVTHMR
ncbi:sterol desaturase family protein [Sphingobium aquiterrae]|uniref:sterol desaturase family protein n=1 Tax=Sphingobium aquiterrae TaxID=2038656 RepID=UPI003015A470